ncbi:hypothetical protein CAL7102_03754 [Dulcicalothrix desertica PCC 7102]|nr:hypothetical protein CAL7102_03754 [Dulcicalothrix desertica PCC 7102]
MSFQVISKPLKNRWMIALIIGATCMTGVTVFYGFSQIGQTPKVPEKTTIPQVKQVTALGKLQPVIMTGPSGSGKTTLLIFNGGFAVGTIWKLKNTWTRNLRRHKETTNAITIE